VVIELGAGTAIASVRYFSQRVVRQFRGKLIRINPREWQTEGPNAVGLAAGALEGLLELHEVMNR
jgi:hypothetical protein